MRTGITPRQLFLAKYQKRRVRLDGRRPQRYGRRLRGHYSHRSQIRYQILRQKQLAGLLVEYCSKSDLLLGLSSDRPIVIANAHIRQPEASRDLERKSSNVPFYIVKNRFLRR